jgi:undecaprenyl pyrophosphate phosphatase UppP
MYWELSMTSAILNSMTQAQRAHTRRVTWLLVVYLIILPPLVWLRAHRHVSDILAIAMAIVASLPVLGIFASWGRYLSEETDEYHHMLVMRRNAIATNATMGAAAVWGFLQAFGVMPLVEAYWIPVVWVVAQGCAPLFFFRKGA